MEERGFERVLNRIRTREPFRTDPEKARRTMRKDNRMSSNNAVDVGPKSDLSLIEPTLREYAPVAGSLITILQKTQDIYGYLPMDVIYHIAEKTGTTPAKIMGVATFYAQFRLTPIGKHLIMLCKGTACHVNGSDRIGDTIETHLGIKNGETTADGVFTLEHVACLGCCSLAPVMMIDGEAYGRLNSDKAIKILDEIRAGEAK